MGKKVLNPIRQLIDKIDVEGLDYALTNYCDPDSISKDDLILAGSVRAYLAVRQAIVDRMKQYGLSDDV